MRTVRLERIVHVPKRHEQFPDELLFDEIGFRHENAEAATKAFADESFEPCLYGRITHPNTNALAQVFCEMEQGEDAIVVSSGMAATATLIWALCESKDEDWIVSSSRIYGGTYEFFHDLLPIMSKGRIHTVFVTDPDQLKLWHNAIRSCRRTPVCLFLETPSNPILGVYDIEATARIAHEIGTLLVVDNTMGIGIQKPILLGADVSISSLTKVATKGKKTGGIIVGGKALVQKCLAVRKLLGCCMDHGAAHKLMKTVRTTPQRMKRHSRNALLLARLLQAYGYRVYYPGFGSKKEQILTKKQMSGYGGNLLSFEIKSGGQKEAMQLLNLLHERGALDIVTHFGEEKITMGVHPASTTHSRMSEEARHAAGITDRLIRISVDATRNFKSITLHLFEHALEKFEKTAG